MATAALKHQNKTRDRKNVGVFSTSTINESGEERRMTLLCWEPPTALDCSLFFSPAWPLQAGLLSQCTCFMLTVERSHLMLAAHLSLTLTGPHAIIITPANVWLKDVHTFQLHFTIWTRWISHTISPNCLFITPSIKIYQYQWVGGIEQNHFCSVKTIIRYTLCKPTKNSFTPHANWKI